MKQILLFVGILFTLFDSCSSRGKGISKNDISGTWKSTDGAVFVFEDDGTFAAKSISADFVLFPRDEYKNLKINGTGKWVLRKGSNNEEVYVEFMEVDDKKLKCAFPLLIAGENGFFENKPPWYLFVWKGEEGEARYEFQKKIIYSIKPFWCTDLLRIQRMAHRHKQFVFFQSIIECPPQLEVIIQPFGVIFQEFNAVHTNRR